MERHYITITTGPILDTLMGAQRTRELWAASYFFSFLMRSIIAELAKGHQDIVETILPNTMDLHAPNLHGAGLYPDRIYLRIISDDHVSAYDSVWKVCEEVVDAIARDIHRDLVRLDKRMGHLAGKEGICRNPFSLEDCRNCLNRYLKLYASQLPVVDGENIVFALSRIADVMDLQPRILPVSTPVEPGGRQEDFPVDQDNRNPLQRFFFLANWNFLFRDGFAAQGEEKRKRSFDSIIEVGSRELGILSPEQYARIIKEEVWDKWDQDRISRIEPDEDIIIQRFRRELRRENRSMLQDYHKYAAIVHADGDNIGKIIAAVGTDPNGIQEFSLALLAFARKATRLVTEYGGAPIYMGGDDMLFLAPVCNRKAVENGKRVNFFQLIDDLDELFREMVAEKFKSKIEDFYERMETPEAERVFPSMSYGVSISFHKYPLYEAKGLSYRMLEGIKQNHPGKNAVKVTLLKHSGQNIPFLIPKGGELWKAFLEFIGQNNDNDSFLNSFTYKLSNQEDVLDCVAADEARTNFFFRNNFNENYTSNQSFFESLTRFIGELAKARPDRKPDHKLLYGILRFVNFIHNPNIKSHESLVSN